MDVDQYSLDTQQRRQPNIPVPPIHLLDPDAQFLAALAARLSTGGFVPHTFVTGHEFLTQITEETSGILILELALPDMSGIELLETLAQRAISPPAIVLTAQATVPSVVRAYRTGRVVAFFQKQTYCDTELMAAIRAAQIQATRERAVYDRCQYTRLCLRQLSPAERKVLELLVEGQSVQRMATTLGVSRRTIQVRRAKFLKVFGVHDYASLNRLVLEAGVFASALPRGQPQSVSPVTTHGVLESAGE